MENNHRTFTLEEKVNLSNQICDALRHASGKIYEETLLSKVEETIETKHIIEIVFNALGKYFLFTLESINSEFAQSPNQKSEDSLFRAFIINLTQLHKMKCDFLHEKFQAH